MNSSTLNPSSLKYSAEGVNRDLVYSDMCNIEAINFGVNMATKFNTCAKCSKKEELTLCSGCRNTFYCGKECQKTDWKKHKIDCNQLKQIRIEAKQAGVKKHSTSFKFDECVDGKIHQMVLTSGVGNTSLFRSPKPDMLPHYIKCKENKDRDDSEESEEYGGPFVDPKCLKFKTIEELHVTIQFLLYCGIYGDEDKAALILQEVLNSLPCQSPWDPNVQWEDISDICIGNLFKYYNDS